MALQRSTRAYPSGTHPSHRDQPSDEDWAPSDIIDAIALNPVDTEVFRFMDLPEEMRREMYSYFLSIPPGEEFQMDQSLISPSNSHIAAILLTSNLVYKEALPVLLRQNRFLIGSSLTNANILSNFGPSRAKYVRFLSIHLNDRPEWDCIEILDGVSAFCDEIRHLELRVSPGSHILPALTSMLRARANSSKSRTDIVFRCSIRKTDAIPASEQAAVHRTALRIEESFGAEFRWPVLLERAQMITVKGCLYKSSLDKLEGLKWERWEMEKTNTLPILDCNFREENVTRTWKVKNDVRDCEVDR